MATPLFSGFWEIFLLRQATPWILPDQGESQSSNISNKDNKKAKWTRTEWQRLRGNSYYQSQRQQNSQSDAIITFLLSQFYHELTPSSDKTRFSFFFFFIVKSFYFFLRNICLSSDSLCWEIKVRPRHAYLFTTVYILIWLDLCKHVNMNETIIILASWVFGGLVKLWLVKILTSCQEQCCIKQRWKNRKTTEKNSR